MSNAYEIRLMQEREEGLNKKIKELEQKNKTLQRDYEVMYLLQQGEEQENQRLQAKIDSLMLEYCPNEMTEEQKKNWAKHQVLAQNKESSNG